MKEKGMLFPRDTSNKQIKRNFEASAAALCASTTNSTIYSWAEELASSELFSSTALKGGFKRFHRQQPCCQIHLWMLFILAQRPSHLMWQLRTHGLRQQKVNPGSQASLRGIPLTGTKLFGAALGQFRSQWSPGIRRKYSLLLRRRKNKPKTQQQFQSFWQLYRPWDQGKRWDLIRDDRWEVKKRCLQYSQQNQPAEGHSCQGASSHSYTTCTRKWEFLTVRWRMGHSIHSLCTGS